MKKVLSIANVVIVNIILLIILSKTVNPFNLSFTEIANRGIEWVFSPSPVSNILMIGSLIGLVVFNLNFILTTKK